MPVLTDPFAITGPFHLVLLGTKAHQTPAVAPWLAAACGPDTDVVPPRRADVEMPNVRGRHAKR
ncbi:MAG: hypothetical protein EBY44_03435 [Actinobacteria bacterium]|nr:hypothetical protein [Actinomycetota bacterium]